MVYMAAIMLFFYPLPWLALGILLANGDFAEILASGWEVWEVR